ncbi:MAG TPA: indole-3-glycerol-phosphate synthase [Nitrososphaeraceae archaeon]|nr:indole-3-glycerol-phosphate synthase [Nitrososphaeraceae archaeon]
MVYASRFSRSSYSLKVLADNSYRSISEGRYDVEKEYQLSHEPLSIRKSILRCSHAPLITEVKLSSPTEGNLSASLDETNIASAAQEMAGNGAVALSVLTQPHLFSGSIKHLSAIRKCVSVPILMKDVIVSEVQIQSAKKIGADCILLIKSVFDSDLAEGSMEKFSAQARAKGLSTLVEVHSENEFKEVLEESANYDLIGINNRDLNTLEVDLDVTRRLLKKYDKGKNIIVSESGIKLPNQIVFLKEAGADAFLIGTGIIKSDNISSKVRELYQSF